MYKIRIFFFFLSALLIVSSVNAQDDLDNYINKLKASKAAGGSETAFMSTGHYFLYGQENLENKNYFYAVMNFEDAIRVDPKNAFALYQLGISLIKQNDKNKLQQAQSYLDKAYNLNPALKDRFKKDVPDVQIPNPTVKQTGLNSYITSLKQSRATGGELTAMNTPGNDALAGIEYYEKQNYDLAEVHFKLALYRDASNPYINYMLGISLLAQGKASEGNKHIAKALEGDASLSNGLAKDVAQAKEKANKKLDKKEVKKDPAPKKEEPNKQNNSGGKLVFGNYACNQLAYNGPNASPAFSLVYKGYFLLRGNGTYRWLDNGAEGKYSYNAASGKITWVSGYFATVNKTKSTDYKLDEPKVGLTEINFPDGSRWSCVCDQK